MDVASLIDLRRQVEDALLSLRAGLEKQLEALGSSIKAEITSSSTSETVLRQIGL
jgi:hypothetical protein